MTHEIANPMETFKASPFLTQVEAIQVSQFSERSCIAQTVYRAHGSMGSLGSQILDSLKSGRKLHARVPLGEISAEIEVLVMTHEDLNDIDVFEVRSLLRTKVGRHLHEYLVTPKDKTSDEAQWLVFDKRVTDGYETIDLKGNLV